MRLLLDTQVALWALTDDLRLSQKARGLILDAHSEVFVSVATLWEIAIKHHLGRGDIPVSGTRAAELFRAAGFVELPILGEHATAVETLPTSTAIRSTACWSPRRLPSPCGLDP
jgi:PIN domain nuclease of toxin-antitoxin system